MLKPNYNGKLYSKLIIYYKLSQRPFAGPGVILLLGYTTLGPND